MTWAIVAGAVIGAGASIYGANQAAGSTRDASRQATQAQLQMYYQGRGDMAPYREAGYSALDQIAQLYGLPPPGRGDTSGMPGARNTYGFATSSGGGGGAPSYLPNPSPLAGLGHNPLDLLGGGGSSTAHVFDPASGNIIIQGRSSGGAARYGGFINPRTGEVTVYAPGTHTVDAELSAQATAAMRSGSASLGDGPWKRINDAIAQMYERGYTYSPQAESAAPGTAPGAAPGRDLSAFYASPQYQFNRAEGLRGLENSAAARGGAFSGNAIRGAEQFASNLASGEFNSYVDRLFNVAGLGNSSSAASANNAMQTGSNLAQIYQNAGNARGSAYLAGAGGVNNALQGGLQNWAFYNYLNQQRAPQSVPGIMPGYSGGLGTGA